MTSLENTQKKLKDNQTKLLSSLADMDEKQVMILSLILTARIVLIRIHTKCTFKEFYWY